MAIHRRGGILSFNIDGQVYEAKGNFTYNLGAPLREEIIGADGIHGYKETHQAAYIEGEFTDSSIVDLASLVNLENVTVTLALGNGKAIVLRQAWFSGDGNVQTKREIFLLSLLPNIQLMKFNR